MASEGMESIKTNGEQESAQGQVCVASKSQLKFDSKHFYFVLHSVCEGRCSGINKGFY